MNLSEDLLLNEPRFLKQDDSVQLVYLKAYALANDHYGVLTWSDDEIAFALRIGLQQWETAKEALIDAGFFEDREESLRVVGWRPMPTIVDLVDGSTTTRIQQEEARVRSSGRSIKEKYPWVLQWQGRFAKEYHEGMLRKVVEYLKTTPAFAPGTGVVPTLNTAKGWLSKGVSLFVESAPEYVQERYQQSLILWDDVETSRPSMGQPQTDDTAQIGKQHVALTMASPDSREELLADRKAVAEAFRKKIKGEQQ